MKTPTTLLVLAAVAGQGSCAVMTKEATRAVARPLSITRGAGLGVARDGAAAPRSQPRQLSASAVCPATPAVIAFSAFFAYEEQQIYAGMLSDCQAADCQGAYEISTTNTASEI